VPATEGRHPQELAERHSLELGVVQGCLKKVRKWRVPPHWSEHDWFEEIGAELAVAVVVAARDFDASRGVPWEGFLGRRVMFAALSRYRREWSYAIRQVSLEAIGEYGRPGADSLLVRDALSRLIYDALDRLPRADASLIEAIFWGGETEAGLARSLGVSQQAINKRKRSIFRTLQRLFQTLARDYDEPWL
jgi:DNA-directed RNA polymerase specialized sigma24 family protein